MCRVVNQWMVGIQSSEVTVMLQANYDVVAMMTCPIPNRLLHDYA